MITFLFIYFLLTQQAMADKLLEDKKLILWNPVITKAMNDHYGKDNYFLEAKCWTVFYDIELHKMIDVQDLNNDAVSRCLEPIAVEYKKTKHGEYLYFLVQNQFDMSSDNRSKWKYHDQAIDPFGVMGAFLLEKSRSRWKTKIATTRACGFKWQFCAVTPPKLIPISNNDDYAWLFEQGLADKGSFISVYTILYPVNHHFEDIACGLTQENSDKYPNNSSHIIKDRYPNIEFEMKMIKRNKGLYDILYTKYKNEIYPKRIKIKMSEDIITYNDKKKCYVHPENSSVLLWGGVLK